MDEATAVFLKALASDTRQQMLAQFSGVGELTAGEIAERSGLRPSTASEHLRLLHRGGLVDARKEGKQIYYRIDSPAVDRRLTVLRDYLDHCRIPPGEAGEASGTEDGHGSTHADASDRGRTAGGRHTVWNRLKESVAAMQAQLVARKNELRSGAFRDASMAMCALVAAADGIIDPAERRRVAQLIATNEVLQHFEAEDLQRLFEANLDLLTPDFGAGTAAVLHEVAKVRKPAEARAVVQIGIVIGVADGEFVESEQAVVREACRALGLTPREFGL